MIECTVEENPLDRLDRIIGSGKLTREEDLVDEFPENGILRRAKQESWKFVSNGKLSFEITRPAEGETYYGDLMGVNRRTVSGGLEIVEMMVVDTQGLVAQALYPEIAGLSHEERLPLMEAGSQEHNCGLTTQGSWVSVDALEPSAAAKFRDGVWNVIADLERRIADPPLPTFRL